MFTYVFRRQALPRYYKEWALSKYFSGVINSGTFWRKGAGKRVLERGPLSSVQFSLVRRNRVTVRLAQSTLIAAASSCSELFFPRTLSLCLCSPTTVETVG